MYIMSGMLSNKDIHIIDEVSKKNAKEEVANGLMDFWGNVLEPYLTKHHEETVQMMGEIKSLREDMHGHEKRIPVFESRTAR